MQARAQPKITVTQWWEAVGQIGNEVAREMKDKIAAAPESDDVKEFQKAKKIYEEMAKEGVGIDSWKVFNILGIKARLEKKRAEFSGDQQQLIKGPISLALANKYLALQRQFNDKQITTTYLPTLTLKEGFENATARAASLDTAIKTYQPSAEEKKTETPAASTSVITTTTASEISASTTFSTTASTAAILEVTAVTTSTTPSTIASTTQSTAPVSSASATSTTITPVKLPHKMLRDSHKKKVTIPAIPFQATTLLEITIQYWNKIEEMVSSHETATNSSKNEDSQECKKALTIYKAMAEIGKDLDLDDKKKSDLSKPQQIQQERKKFGDTQQQKIIGPFTLNLATQYLALQKEHRALLDEKSSEIAEAFIPVNSIQQLEAAIEEYNKLQTQAPSTFTTTQSSQSTTSSSAESSSPSFSALPPTSVASPATTPTLSAPGTSATTTSSSSSSSSSTTSSIAPEENKKIPEEAIAKFKKIYGETATNYITKIIDEKKLNLSDLNLEHAKEEKNEIDFCVKNAAILAVNHPEFLTHLINEASKKFESSESLLLTSMHQLAQDLAAEAKTILADNPSTEEKQKIARSLVKVLAVLRNPDNEKAVQKVKDDVAQTVGASDRLKQFFGILCLFAIAAVTLLSIPSSGGASLLTLGQVITGDLLLAGAACSFFHYGKEKQLARKEHEFADAAEAYLKGKTPKTDS